MRAVSDVPRPFTEPSLSNVTELLMKRKLAGNATENIILEAASMKSKATHSAGPLPIITNSGCVMGGVTTYFGI